MDPSSSFKERVWEEETKKVAVFSELVKGDDIVKQLHNRSASLKGAWADMAVANLEAVISLPDLAPLFKALSVTVRIGGIVAVAYFDLLDLPADYDETGTWRARGWAWGGRGVGVGWA